MVDPSRPALKQLAEPVLAGLLLGALCYTKTWDYDVWYHLAIGRLIVEGGAVPTLDIFSFTHQGAPLGHVEWVPDAILYGLFSAFGMMGLSLFKASCGALVGALVFARARALGADRVVAWAFVLPALLLAQPRLTLDRPLGLFFVWLCLSLWLFERLRSTERPDWRVVGVLACIPWFWVQSHGSALLSPVIAGIYWFEAALLSRRGEGAGRRAYALLAVLGCSLCALLMTDAGWAILAHNFALQGGGGSLPIAEWMPLDFAHATEKHAGRVLLLAVGALVALRFAKERPADALLTVLFLALTFRAMRFAYVAVLVAAPILAGSWGRALASRSARRVASFGAALGLGFLLVGTAGVSGAVIIVDPGSGVSSMADFPSAPLAALRERSVEGPLFHSMADGGYLIFHAPEYPVFVDGRGVNVYPRDFFVEACEGESSTPSALSALLEQYGVQAAMLRIGLHSDYLSAAPAGWKLIWGDDTHLIFVRTEGVNRSQQQSASNRLRFFANPVRGGRWYARFADSASECAALRDEVARARKRWPASARLTLVERWLAAQPKCALLLERRHGVPWSAAPVRGN